MRALLATCAVILTVCAVALTVQRLGVLPHHHHHQRYCIGGCGGVG
jgi:hypothetical protein